MGLCLCSEILFRESVSLPKDVSVFLIKENREDEDSSADRLYIVEDIKASKDTDYALLDIRAYSILVKAHFEKSLNFI